MKKLLSLFLASFLLLQNSAFADWRGGWNDGDVAVDRNSVDFDERNSDPPTPSANRIKIYAKDNGGVTSLYQIDSNGTVAELGSDAAPLDATFITQTANADLTNEQDLSSLSTGIVKNTTGTGVLSIAVAGVDYQAAGSASSVSNSDGTLTISPTTGAVVASLALSHANTWTASQTFAPPQPASVSSGIAGAGPSPIIITAPNGGDSTGTAGTTAGTGGFISWTMGTGGVANSVTSSTTTGGAGGGVSLTSGKGGSPSIAQDAVLCNGGVGGGYIFNSGAGGDPTNNSTGTATAGSGGSFSMTANRGGNATSSSGTATGGTGGSFSLQSGAGGTATSSGTKTYGQGGLFALLAGSGASSNTSTVAGSGGAMTVTSGGGGPNVFSSGNGGPAGALSISGGTGGSVLGPGTGGAGADATVSAGSGGSSSGGTGGVGGSLVLQAGAGAGSSAGGPIVFKTAVTNSLATVGTIDKSGHMTIGDASSPTAVLRLAAGTASASGAPLKMVSGPVLSSKEVGAWGFDTDTLSFTITTGTAEKHLMLDDGTLLTSTRIPIATTNGRLTDNSGLTFASSVLTVPSLDSTASVGFNVTALSGDTTLSASHHTVLVSASGGNITITLPAASGVTRREYVIKKTDISANTVTIDANSTEKIDGALTYVLNNIYEFVRIQCDGSNWYLV